MTAVHGFGLGVATQNGAGDILDVFYPAPIINISGDLAQAVSGVNGAVDATLLNELESAFNSVGAPQQAAIAKQLKESTAMVVATTLVEDSTPKSVADAYLKLHMLSHRLVRPHGTNL